MGGVSGDMGRLKPLDFRENLPVPTDGRLPLNLSYAMAFAVTMRVWIWHVAHRVSPPSLTPPAYPKLTHSPRRLRFTPRSEMLAPGGSGEFMSAFDWRPAKWPYGIARVHVMRARPCAAG